jgi:transcription-repair coupling factor (superfamily II helicase)
MLLYVRALVRSAGNNRRRPVNLQAMRLADWVRFFAETEPAKSLLSGLDRSAEWSSVAAEARPMLVAAAYLRQPRKTLIVTSTYERCLAWQAKLTLCGIPDHAVEQLPSGIATLFEDAAPEHMALSERIGALKALTAEEPCVVVGTAAAVLERTLPRDVLDDAFIDIRPGMEIDPERLLRQLTTIGYEHQEPVRLPGQFSRRGGIVDVYASGHDLPVRIELFGDEVESLRLFDPNSQRSVGKLPALSLAPSRETLYTGNAEETRDLVLHALEQEAAKLDPESAARLEELVSADADALSQRVFFNRLDLYRPMLHPESGCALDLLDDDDLLFLDEPLELEAVAARSEEELAQSLKARHDRGEILFSTANDFMLPPEHLSTRRLTISMSAMNALPEWLRLENRQEVNAASLAPYRGLG